MQVKPQSFHMCGFWSWNGVCDDLFRIARRSRAIKQNGFLLTENMERWGKSRQLCSVSLPVWLFFCLVLHQNLKLEIICFLIFGVGFFCLLLCFSFNFIFLCSPKILVYFSTQKGKKNLSIFAPCFTKDSGVLHTVLISFWHITELEMVAKPLNGGFISYFDSSGLPLNPQTKCPLLQQVLAT